MHSMTNPFFRVFLATRSDHVMISAVSYILSHYASSLALLGMSSLSNWRETQHLSRFSRLPPIEHSPTLQLIHTSEVWAAALSPQPKPSAAKYTGSEILNGAVSSTEQSQKGISITEDGQADSGEDLERRHCS